MAPLMMVSISMVTGIEILAKVTLAVTVRVMDVLKRLELVICVLIVLVAFSLSIPIVFEPRLVLMARLDVSLEML